PIQSSCRIGFPGHVDTSTTWTHHAGSGLIVPPEKKPSKTRCCPAAPETAGQHRRRSPTRSGLAEQADQSVGLTVGARAEEDRVGAAGGRGARSERPQSGDGERFAGGAVGELAD